MSVGGSRSDHPTQQNPESPAAAVFAGQWKWAKPRRSWKPVSPRIWWWEHPSAPPYDLLADSPGGDATFEELAVPFHTVAASVEAASERWFSSGALIPAVVASASVPGLFPPR